MAKKPSPGVFFFKETDLERGWLYQSRSEAPDEGTPLRSEDARLEDKLLLDSPALILGPMAKKTSSEDGVPRRILQAQKQRKQRILDFEKRKKDGRGKREKKR